MSIGYLYAGGLDQLNILKYDSKIKKKEKVSRVERIAKSSECLKYNQKKESVYNDLVGSNVDYLV